MRPKVQSLHLLTRKSGHLSFLPKFCHFLVHLQHVGVFFSNLTFEKGLILVFIPEMILKSIPMEDVFLKKEKVFHYICPHTCITYLFISSLQKKRRKQNLFISDLHIHANQQVLPVVSRSAPAIYLDYLCRSPKAQVDPLGPSLKGLLYDTKIFIERHCNNNHITK